MTQPDHHASAAEIAVAIAEGRVTAQQVVEGTLARITATNPHLNAFTHLTAERARAKAAAVDAARTRGEKLPPLAGVPYAVKNLFDIKGLATIAGSKINRSHAPALRDATLIEKLDEAGAILVGALNMGEYAYDFTGENVHDGPSRNPHDLTCMSGGSSGGSGSAVGGSMVPLALGSDTNGSIRVPSSFCGIFGLKPTYGRLSRARTFPFVAAFDHLGPFARSTRDLALAYDAMQGMDDDDDAQTERPLEPALASLDQGLAGLRIAVAGGYFRKGLCAEGVEALARVTKALAITQEIELPEVHRARSAAFIITASEAAGLHLDRLRTRPEDFDPFARDRLLAGALVPHALVIRAQKFRRWFHDRMLDVFNHVDVIIAPATPCIAPKLGETLLDLDGVKVPLRANIGIYTQPISFIGLPVVAVPIPVSPMPIGVQVIAAPWREDLALRVAAALEKAGIAAAPRGVL